MFAGKQETRGLDDVGMRPTHFSFAGSRLQQDIFATATLHETTKPRVSRSESRGPLDKCDFRLDKHRNERTPRKFGEHDRRDGTTGLPFKPANSNMLVVDICLDVCSLRSRPPNRIVSVHIHSDVIMGPLQRLFRDWRENMDLF